MFFLCAKYAFDKGENPFKITVTESEDSQIFLPAAGYENVSLYKILKHLEISKFSRPAAGYENVSLCKHTLKSQNFLACGGYENVFPL